VAEAATPGPWRDCGGYVTAGPDGPPLVQVTDYGTHDEEDTGPQGQADSAHIARHDPARVLRDMEAKRKLLGDYAEATANDVDGSGWASALGHTVRLLALPYADQPGYREKWRP
jgi:hypothetical protein